MLGLRTALVPVRLWWAALFALLLALRSLSPAGFMPAFEHGAVTIVVCPEAGNTLAMAHHHHPGEHKNIHETCPYAPTAALGALGPGPAWLAPVVFFAPVLLLGRTFLLVERLSSRERPPLRGPPIPA